MQRNRAKAMTSGDLKTCDFAKDYFEFRKVLFSRNEPARHLTCGSFFEITLMYYFSNPTDIDVMFCDMTLCLVYDHVNVPEVHSRNVLTIDIRDCHVGFVRFKNSVGYYGKPFGSNNRPA